MPNYRSRRIQRSGKSKIIQKTIVEYQITAVVEYKEVEKVEEYKEQ